MCSVKLGRKSNLYLEDIKSALEALEIGALGVMVCSAVFLEAPAVKATLCSGAG